MESGKIIEIGGQYCCLYHLKNKIQIKKGSTLPECNYQGLNCKGNWHLLKEIKEKTPAEKKKDQDKRRQQQDRRKWMDVDAARERKKPRFNKWDFEKW
ncbi:MAG: hypothetical protein ABI855_18530 [Bacteroidota bacterium]